MRRGLAEQIAIARARPQLTRLPLQLRLQCIRPRTGELHLVALQVAAYLPFRVRTRAHVPLRKRREPRRDPLHAQAMLERQLMCARVRSEVEWLDQRIALADVTVEVRQRRHVVDPLAARHQREPQAERADECCIAEDIDTVERLRHDRAPRFLDRVRVIAASASQRDDGVERAEQK